MKYRVDWFTGKQHNKTYFSTREDAVAYSTGIARCTCVDSVFILEYVAIKDAYDVLEMVK